ncbi:MAG: hypothetical protein U0V74_17565 [Chitinophagales bacterium]
MKKVPLPGVGLISAVEQFIYAERTLKQAGLCAATLMTSFQKGCSPQQGFTGSQLKQKSKEIMRPDLFLEGITQ